MGRRVLASLVVVALAASMAWACDVAVHRVTPETMRRAESVVVQAIRAAQQSLDVVAPTFPYGPIGDAVADTADRGVTVRVILDAEEGRLPSNAAWVAAHDIPFALEPSASALVHQFIVVDAQRVIVGPFIRLEQPPQTAYLDLIVMDCRAERGDGTAAARYVEAFADLWSALAIPGSVSVAPPAPRAEPESVLLYHVDPAGECIELINRSAEPVDIAGWALSDLEGRYIFPEKTILFPDDPFAVCIAVYNKSYDPQGLYLNDEHDEVFLSSPEGEILDEVVW